MGILGSAVVVILPAIACIFMLLSIRDTFSSYHHSYFIYIAIIIPANTDQYSQRACACVSVQNMVHA